MQYKAVKAKSFNGKTYLCTNCCRDKDTVTDCRLFLQERIENGHKSCKDGFIYIKL